MQQFAEAALRRIVLLAMAALTLASPMILVSSQCPDFDCRSCGVSIDGYRSAGPHDRWISRGDRFCVRPDALWETAGRLKAAADRCSPISIWVCGEESGHAATRSFDPGVDMRPPPLVLTSEGIVVPLPLFRVSAVLPEIDLAVPDPLPDRPMRPPIASVRA